MACPLIAAVSKRYSFVKVHCWHAAFANGKEEIYGDGRIDRVLHCPRQPYSHSVDLSGAKPKQALICID